MRHISANAPFKPTPPEGYVLHRQHPNGDLEPPIPVMDAGGLVGIMVWNPWQRAWEKARWLADDPCWYATKEPT